VIKLLYRWIVCLLLLVFVACGEKEAKKTNGVPLGRKTGSVLVSKNNNEDIASNEVLVPWGEEAKATFSIRADWAYKQSKELYEISCKDFDTLDQLGCIVDFDEMDERRFFVDRWVWQVDTDEYVRFVVSNKQAAMPEGLSEREILDKLNYIEGPGQLYNGRIRLKQDGVMLHRGLIESYAGRQGIFEVGQISEEEMSRHLKGNMNLEMSLMNFRREYETISMGVSRDKIQEENIVLLFHLTIKAPATMPLSEKKQFDLYISNDLGVKAGVVNLRLFLSESYGGVYIYGPFFDEAKFRKD